MNHSAPSSAAGNVPPLPKPIRFVTNHDGPYAKRRRINSACFTCRRKKTRCSGERPVCGTCLQNNHECAGYGNEHDNSSPTEASRKARRESNGSSNAPARGAKQEGDTHRPPLPPVPSNPSHGSESPANNNNGLPRIERDDAHALSLSTRNRMPYFRYFGPTAIMPGFKQMVVKVRGKQHGTGHTTSDPIESSPGLPPSVGSPPQTEARTPVDIPVYDTSSMSPSPLITHLCKLFFTHLGCNFPFLQKERFMRDLEEKQVDAILVDAVCALAARYSSHPLLTGLSDPPKEKEREAAKLHPSEYGQAFALRAKSAIPDTFSCPNVAVVQAALLLAYDEFGASRDSGLWMYLGITIRMAQDLGMQTLEGLKYEGRDGPTPKSVKTGPSRSGSESGHGVPEPRRTTSSDPAIEEQRAVERERIDTFWAIFILDRIISSGTGRPVTLKDREIEISFPSLNEIDPTSGWPLPFPALIRIVHLYGRVTDLLNSIKEKSHMNDDLRKQLDLLENHLTEIYQGLSPKLHFNAVNFQHYVKINQGTNFLLLHCWFHTLIVLLHQPTLLKPFEGSAQTLSRDSRELSMSSAKTIADILVFTDLIDAKTMSGAPFTSQPIYIAACAFLKETALQSSSSNPHSHPSTPGSGQRDDFVEVPRTNLDHMRFDKPISMSNNERTTQEHESKPAPKHALLASAANQNYQRCYRALKSLETYWAGVKYILTVLDQLAKGVGDPLLYTTEEMDSALELPRPEPAFTTPGWRRKLSWGTYLTAENVADVNTSAKVPAAVRNNRARTPTIPGSPLHPSQAIGWSLTGTMDSPSTNVSVMYTSDRDTKPSNPSIIPASTQPSIASILSNPAGPPSNLPPIKFETTQSTHLPSIYTLPSPAQQNFDPSSMPPPSTTYTNIPTPDPVLVSDADLLLNLHSPYASNSPNSSRLQNTFPPHQSHQSQQPQPQHQQRNSSISSLSAMQLGPGQEFSSPNFAQYPTPSDIPDMVIDSQEVDMSLLGADMMPWDLEYLPHDMWSFGDDGVGDGS